MGGGLVVWETADGTFSENLCFFVFFVKNPGSEDTHSGVLWFFWLFTGFWEDNYKYTVNNPKNQRNHSLCAQNPGF